MERIEELKTRVNKLWRRNHTPNLKNGAEYEFKELLKHLSEKEKEIAQNCWDKLEKDFNEKTSR